MPKKALATKVATPKKVVAKKTAKKTSASSVGKKELVYADGARSFWLHDGQVLNSLLALRDALNQMEKTVFVHHVNSDKNDFADWVDRVLDDASCAADLRKAKTAKGAHTIVVRYLKVYQI
jgi:hypothetical protein